MMISWHDMMVSWHKMTILIPCSTWHSDSPMTVTMETVRLPRSCVEKKSMYLSTMV